MPDDRDSFQLARFATRCTFFLGLSIAVAASASIVGGNNDLDKFAGR